MCSDLMVNKTQGSLEYAFVKSKGKSMHLVSATVLNVLNKY